MDKIDFETVVEKGTIPSERHRILSDFFKTHEGKPVRVRVEPRRKIRSENQNKYYWYMLQFIADELGYEGGYDPEIAELVEGLVAAPALKNRVRFMLNMIFKPTLGREEIHEIFKGMFLVDSEGNPRTTTGLTTEEAEKYYSQIRHYCARELHIIVPEPHQAEWL